MRLVTIIVNWNAPEDTIACLESLVRQEVDLEIILVDNGSSDDSIIKICDWAEKNVPSYIKLLELTEREAPLESKLLIVPLNDNFGFGAANNIGMKYALNTGAEFVLILNNDTIVPPYFISTLLSSAQNIKNLGILGCSIYYYDRPNIIWFSGGKIDFFRGAFYHKNKKCTGIKKTDFVTGCLMLVPCKVLKLVGLFNEEFFLNVEDVELSTRISDKGYELLIDCEHHIYHKVSVSIGGLYSEKNQYYFSRNRLFYFKNILSGKRKIIFFIVQFFLLIPSWFLIQIIHGRFSAIRGAFLGYRDFLMCRSGQGIS